MAAAPINSANHDWLSAAKTEALEEEGSKESNRKPSSASKTSQ